MKKIVKDALVLFAITLVAGILLGVVYQITLDPIAKANENAKEKAYKAVLAEAAKLEGDEKTGALIVARALEAPLRTIVQNAGLEGAIVVNKVKESADGIGFDAVSEEYVDMMANGIIDPVKVTDSALVNAESIASTLLTTEAAVGNIPEKKPAMPTSPEMGY